MIRRASALLLVGLVGCASEAPSLPACPPQGTEVTYENFGRAFFEGHCNHCHGGGDDETGHAHSVSSRAFVTEVQIRKQATNIALYATGDNPSMPPGPKDPSESERKRLTEWLSCGAP
jgi:uncharacterized membrane protein